jgi:hypothetical protein
MIVADGDDKAGGLVSRGGMTGCHLRRNVCVPNYLSVRRDVRSACTPAAERTSARHPDAGNANLVCLFP